MRADADAGHTLAGVESNQVVGAWGERIAAQWLAARGWSVLHRRFRSGRRDIDLVVRRGSTVAFVEVKTRRTLRYGDPVAAVGYGKLEQLRRSALVWILRHGMAGLDYRVDVCGVLIQGDRVRIRHVENAHVFDISR